MLVGSWRGSAARLKELVLVSEPLMLHVKGFRGLDGKYVAQQA